MKDKNVIFMGTPDFAVKVLEALISHTNVSLVVTQPDKEVGRKHEIKYSSIKEVALKNNIKIFQPTKIRKDFDIIKELNPDLIVTCAYGQILPKELLDIPKYGSINVHASILPKYRGGAPIHRAIMNGEDKTGITIMYMDEGMDTGDIISIKECKIDKTDNAGTLHDKLSTIGAELLIKTLPDIFCGKIKRIKQDNSLATFAPVIKREDELLDFNKSVDEVLNKIRGLNPWPLSYFYLNDTEIKVLEAEGKKMNVLSSGKISTITKNEFSITAKDGLIFLKTIKPMGRKAMHIKDYLNGVDHEKLKREGKINCYETNGK